ncbi:MAG: hypothetical protein NVSMB51_17480 [Solirubrobacteraceae bacterium]
MRRIFLAAISVCLLVVPAGALADGDPASDVLLGADAFYPYQPLVTLPLTKTLNQTVAAAHAAGFPIKVALIATANDLGAVPDLFGKPQQYADFLDREISFNKKDLLLVVMPQGFGVTAAGSAAALSGIAIKPASGSSDGLAAAGIRAVAVLAGQAGHPIRPPVIPKSGASGGGGTSPLITFGAPVLLVVVAALGVGLIRRGREEDAEIAT